MNFSNLTDYLDKLALCVPAVDCIIYKDGEKIYRHNPGMKDFENKIKMTDNTLVYLYSTSKVITTTAAMQLLEKGKFLLKDRLSDYMPMFKDMTVQTEDGVKKAENPILIEDLFTMSAGFTYDLNTPQIKAVQEKTNMKASTMEILQAIADTPLAFEPHTHYNYSLCHDVLAGLIETISGMSFGEYLKKNIFEPCEMTHSFFTVPDELKDDCACQYAFDDNAGKLINTGFTCAYKLSDNYESGGAGIISCTEDYGKFVGALANGGKTKNGNRILSEGSIELAKLSTFTDESRINDFKAKANMPGFTYGLGVRCLSDKAEGGYVASEGGYGWDGAAGCLAHIDNKRGIGIFYCQNMLNSHSRIIHPRLLNAIYSGLDD